MSLVVYLVVTFGAAGLAIALRGRHAWSVVVGLLGLAGATAAAVAMRPGETLLIGGDGLATTAYLRLFLILGSTVGLALSVAGLASGSRRDAPAVTLAILGAAGLTMGLVDPRSAVLVATAGPLFGVLVTLIPSGGRAGATVGIRETRAVVVAGAFAIAATAWIGRDLSELSAQPVVFGLAYLAFAVAVAMRFGAIPFHLWAARLTDVVPETALPVLTALAPASLAVVALAWIDASVAPLALDLGPERSVVLAVAIASIVLAAIAAFVQDDIEHVLGYSIVGDAGVIILALAALRPEAWPAARTWILAYVVARSAFAAWAAGIRAGFFTGRITDLRGWARRAPVLAVAFVLVMIASVGFPGLVAFEARRTLVDLTLEGPLATIVALATLAPLGYYLRLLVIGFQPSDGIVQPIVAWRPRGTAPDLTALRRWARGIWQTNRAFTTALVAALLGVLALATAAGAFDGPAAAAGLPPSIAVPGEIEPSGSAGPGPGAGPSSPAGGSIAPEGSEAPGTSTAPGESVGQ
ncbi:MAG: proton-conducting transporter membrane subunit [Chloroflexota bacterium]